MVKWKLQLDEEVKLKLLGIQSNWSEHRLVWSINKSLGLQLTRQEDFSISNVNKSPNDTLFEDQKEYHFSVFLHEGEQEQAILVSNLGQGRSLYDDKRKLDYLFKLESSHRSIHDCVDTLNEIRGVLAITRLECSDEDLVARPFTEHL
ncbi:MAG: IPExxxVDY family protein [Flavobacteriales bacterium]|nr:IPExxxVDY family protein [Flavobacteriales bacterium]